MDNQKVGDIVRAVHQLTFVNTFNPYSDTCQKADRQIAARIRFDNLRKSLVAAGDGREIDAIWIGRDLGYLGGRRTGMALTDEPNMSRHAARWGFETESPIRASKVGESTAKVMWEMLDKIPAHLFLWNVFPLHPHEPGNPFSNRPHNQRERKAGMEILDALIHLLNPRRLVCFGNDAESAAKKLKIGWGPVVKIRHPSYGGQTQFREQVRALYQIKTEETLL